jgi:hypothetical protein
MEEKDKDSLWNRIEENKKIVPYIINTCTVILILLTVYNFYTGRLTVEDFKFW